MEPQNVSAQLYHNQLPNVLASNDQESDQVIENAFQSQLNLSEYYKSPAVFESMKQEYTSKTMEPQELQQEAQEIQEPPTKEIITPQLFNKSNFGGGGSLIVFIILAILAILFFYLKNKTF